MAGLINVGILKPELAGSFAAGYRGAEEQRNALAQRQQQAAQAEQQLASGRQRLQMDEMTMQRMQEDRAALTGLQAKLRAAGQSDDPRVFFKALTESNDPNIMMKGIEGLQRYQALEAYDREFGPRAGAPAMPSSAPNAMVAPSMPAPRVERGVDAYGKPFEAEVGGGIAPRGAMGQPLAPFGAAPPAPAAPTAPINAIAPVSAMPDVNALRRQYSMAVAAGRADAPVLLEQIKAALKPDPSELRTMQQLGYQLTPEGYREFRLAQMNVQDGALVPIVGPGGRPIYATRAQAAGQTPFTPAAVQVLGMGPQQGPAARGAAPSAPAGKPPTPAQVAKDKRMEEARTALSKDIETQLSYYNDLNNLGAMVTSAGPNASVAGNVTAFARSTGVGQNVERALGTKAQTLRDNIKNTRQRLFMQIKDATGATASQMNSNAEMQAWLNSMTDPQQSIETVQETLKQMDSVIAGVQRDVEQAQAGKKSPAKPATTAPALTPNRRDLGGGFKLVD